MGGAARLKPLGLPSPTVGQPSVGGRPPGRLRRARRPSNAGIGADQQRGSAADRDATDRQCRGGDEAGGGAIGVAFRRIPCRPALCRTACRRLQAACRRPADRRHRGRSRDRSRYSAHASSRSTGGRHRPAAAAFSGCRAWRADESLLSRNTAQVLPLWKITFSDVLL